MVCVCAVGRTRTRGRECVMHNYRMGARDKVEFRVAHRYDAIRLAEMLVVNLTADYFLNRAEGWRIFISTVRTLLANQDAMNDILSGFNANLLARAITRAYPPPVQGDQKAAAATAGLQVIVEADDDPLSEVVEPVQLPLAVDYFAPARQANFWSNRANFQGDALAWQDIFFWVIVARRLAAIEFPEHKSVTVEATLARTLAICRLGNVSDPAKTKIVQDTNRELGV